MCQSPIVLNDNSSIHAPVGPFHPNCWEHLLDQEVAVCITVAVHYLGHRVAPITMHASSLRNSLLNKWPHANLAIKDAITGSNKTRVSNCTQEHYLDQMISVLRILFRGLFVRCNITPQLFLRNEEPLFVDVYGAIQMVILMIVRQFWHRKLHSLQFMDVSQ